MPRVIIKTRDLDTDEKDFNVHEIERIPDNALRRGQLLTELVSRQHPRARQQSLANDVASFVDPNHLIVAKYAQEDLEEALRNIARRGMSEASADDQDQLFAA